ncbi:MAG TPA: pitrilysin family protein [Kofleriaceae bacterium]|jgi:zinc protease|nr:pitrilysin family protein [Kofleriaceae bacterium]
MIGKLPAIETFALPNGLQVAVVHRETAPVVSVQVWYHVGSKDERRDRRGTAHMFEHMMFKGTAHVRPDAHTQSINGLGGYVSAATDEDATHYANTLPAEYLEYAVKLEAERMRNLLFRAPMIDAQREVLLEELREQSASPLAKGLEGCLWVAYQKHPYAWTASGNAKDLAAITAEDLKRFYDAYYEPNNALLVVVGKVAAADVKASADKWFGGIAKANEPPRPAAVAQEPPESARRREVAEPGQIGMTLVGWHIPAARNKDIYALQLASVVLGAGDSSRLKLRLKTADPKTGRSLAFEAGMDAIVREDPGMAIALGAYSDPAQADAVEAAIFDEVGKLATRGTTGDELRRAKNQLQSSLVFSLESAQGLGEAIGRSWILTGNPGAFLRDIDEIDKVSAADVQRVARQYLSSDHATVVVFPPKAR